MRSLIFAFCILLSAITSKGADLLLDSSGTPHEGGRYTSLYELTFVFNFSNVDFSKYSLDQTGLEAMMGKNMMLKAYKGNSTDGELIFSLNQYVDVDTDDCPLGANSISFKLDKEYILEPDQEYTLHIPGDIFSLTATDGSYTVLATLPETDIHFWGEVASADELIWEGQTPENNSFLTELGELQLSFNSDIETSPNAEAMLYEGEDLLKSVTLSVSAEDAKMAVADFSGEVLYYSHKYTVKVPENSILAKGTTNGYREIELNYDGASYNYLSYGRISPRQGEVNYLATINVPIVCETGFGLGRAKAPTAYLYKDGVEEPIQTVKCTLGIDGKSWEIPFYNFNLDPSSTYNVVMPAHQFSIWKTLESGGYNEVKDTSNPELTLTYTTPAEITLPDPIQFGTSDPANGASLEKLEKIKVNFDRYTFDEQSYYPYFASSTLEAGWNIVHLYKDGSEEPIADIEVDVKWDDNNNYWLESVNPINATLYEGQNYKVVIPAGMFIASEEKLAPISANKEYEIALQGATPTVSALGLAFDNAGLVASALCVVSFSTSDEVTVAADAKMQLLNGEETVAETAIYVAYEGEKYRAYADFGNFKLAEGIEYTVVLPAASLYAADGIVNNEQMTATVSGLPVVVVPTYNNVDLTVNGCVKSQYVVETGKSVEIEVSPLNTDWELATLTLDGTDVTEAVVDGKYVVESVEADLDLAAEFAYAHEITYDYTSGIDAPYDSPYSVRSEGGNLVISGVQGGDVIAVYSVNGMKMSNLPAVPDGKNEVSISLQTGNVYIVLINNVSLKIQH